MERKLIAILNTEHNMERYKAENMTRQELEEKAIYKELDDKHRKSTFSEIIRCLVKGGEGIADEIADYLEQHNGFNLICEVRVYDENGERKRNKDGSEVMGLEESIAPYMDTRKVKSTSEDYDCLEMTADLYSDVGAR